MDVELEACEESRGRTRVTWKKETEAIFRNLTLSVVDTGTPAPQRRRLPYLVFYRVCMGLVALLKSDAVIFCRWDQRGNRRTVGTVL